MKLFSKSFDLALALSGRQPEKKLGKQRSVFPGRRRTEKVASRKLGCGPAPRTIPCPPPSLIPKGGTRLGRGDRKARCENLCRLWRHGGPPARVLHLKMSHRDIFSLSCACWRYKTVGRCPTPCQLSFEKAGQRTLPAYGAHASWPLDEHERSELPLARLAWGATPAHASWPLDEHERSELPKARIVPRGHAPQPFEKG